MSDTIPVDLEALLQAEVDRAVAPYEGRIPPWALDKMRELAARYWRENPVAVDALRRKVQSAQLKSGTEAIRGEGERPDRAKERS